MKRRRFLLLLGAILGSLGVIGVANFWPYLKYYLTPVETTSGIIKAQKPNRFIDEEGKSIVGVVLGTGQQNEVADMVKTSVDIIGGIEKLDIAGKTALLKPNLNSGDLYPASTNPQVVKGVIEMLYNAGASKVIVGDMSNPSYRTEDAMKRAGITDVVEETGASPAYFEEGEWMLIKIPGVKHIREIILSKPVYDADVLIDMPTVKTHSMATYTMSMKNFIGVIHHKSRMSMHRSQNLEEAIAELNLAIHPDLIVMDGTRSMVSGGPMKGTVKNTNLIVASGDRIANDIIGLSVVKKFGLWERVSNKDVWDQTQIKKALDLSIGRGRDEIKLVSHSFPGEESSDTLLKDIQQISGL